MSTAPDAYRVMCVHSTRRTRRNALEGARETRCCHCGATVLLHDRTVEAAGAAGAKTVYPLCPGCTITLSDPDELVGDAVNVPDLAEILEADGCEDGEAQITATAGVTLHEFAANALRHTVGGQG